MATGFAADPLLAQRPPVRPLADLHPGQRTRRRLDQEDAAAALAARAQHHALRDPKAHPAWCQIGHDDDLASEQLFGLVGRADARENRAPFATRGPA